MCQYRHMETTTTEETQVTTYEQAMAELTRAFEDEDAAQFKYQREAAIKRQQYWVRVAHDAK